MIITEYETTLVRSHKDLEITPEFLAAMTNYLHDEENNIPDDFVITEDMIEAWANHHTETLTMPIHLYGDGTVDTLDDWITDYMVEYFNDYVLNSYIDDRDWYDSTYRVWKK